MTTMEIMCLIVLVSFVCICCFILGVKVGQKVVKGEEVKIELPSPIKAISNARERKEIKRELDKLDIITQNIDNYDGTGAYQREIPE